MNTVNSSQQNRQQFRVLRIKEVIHLVGLSRSAIYDRINPKSPRYDESFPKPLKLGMNSRNIAVGWLERDLIQWMMKCVESNN